MRAPTTWLTLATRSRTTLQRLPAHPSPTTTLSPTCLRLTRKKDAEMVEMSAQIKQLTASVAKLAAWGQQKTDNDDPNKNRGYCGDRIVEQMIKLCNMGGYCSTHGFHPVGVNHNSVTCQFKKKDVHNDAAMEKPPQRQHLLAQSHPRRCRTAEPPNMERQGQARLTGTRGD